MNALTSIPTDELFGIVEQLGSVDSLHELGDIVRTRTSKSLGVRSCTVLATDRNASFPWRVVFSTWTGQEIDLYRRDKGSIEGLQLQEIVGKTLGGFLWWSPAHRLEGRSRFLAEDIFGVSRGWVVPSYDTNGDVWVVILGGDFEEEARLKSAIRFFALFVTAAVQRLDEINSRRNTPLVTLTPRQREVLQLVMAGKSDWEIGTILNVSEHTVSSHLESAKRKLGVRTRVQAVVAAIECGIIQM